MTDTVSEPNRCRTVSFHTTQNCQWKNMICRCRNPAEPENAFNVPFMVRAVNLIVIYFIQHFIYRYIQRETETEGEREVHLMSCNTLCLHTYIQTVHLVSCNTHNYTCLWTVLFYIMQCTGRHLFHVTKYVYRFISLVTMLMSSVSYNTQLLNVSSRIKTL